MFPFSSTWERTKSEGEIKALPSQVLPFPFPPAKRRGEGHRTEPSCASPFQRSLPCNPCWRPLSSSSPARRRTAKQAERIPRSLRSRSPALKVTGGHASAPRPPHGNVLYPGIRGGCLRQALLPRGPWLLAGSGKDSAVRSDRRAAGGLGGGCYGLEPPVPATSFHGAVVSEEGASIEISSSVVYFF